MFSQIHRIVISADGCDVTKYCRLFLNTSRLPKVKHYHKSNFQGREEHKMPQQHEQQYGLAFETGHLSDQYLFVFFAITSK